MVGARALDYDAPESGEIDVCKRPLPENFRKTFRAIIEGSEKQWARKIQDYIDESQDRYDLQ
jgi:hypothetical protein